MIGANDFFIAAHARRPRTQAGDEQHREFNRGKGPRLENWMTNPARRPRRKGDMEDDAFGSPPPSREALIRRTRRRAENHRFRKTTDIRK